MTRSENDVEPAGLEPVVTSSAGKDAGPAGRRLARRLTSSVLGTGGTTPRSGRSAAVDALDRLGGIALLAVLIMAIIVAINFVAPELLEENQWVRQAGLVPLGVSLVVLVAAWRRWIPDRAVPTATSFYELVLAASAAMVVNAIPLPQQPGPPAWSPVAVFVAIFPIVVPTAFWRTLVTSVVATSVDPLAYALFVRWGLVPPAESFSVLFIRFFPNALALLPALLLSTVMYRLGRELTRARELGSYELVDQLGIGGMGEVWRARHRMLARDAAVKLIRPEVVATDADADRVFRRFEREARSTAALRSPHTIELYDFGRTEDGSFYYAMELLDGLDLETLVARDGAQPAGRVVRILRQVCHSLAEAHRDGLVHRDIKPANVFLCRYGLDVDFVKVLDFGLVADQRGLTGTVQGGASLTGEGHFAGTAAFVAPEIAMGEPSDGRADLYALGVWRSSC